MRRRWSVGRITCRSGASVPRQRLRAEMREFRRPGAVMGLFALGLEATEVKLRSERKAGQFLKDMKEQDAAKGQLPHART